MHVCHKCKKIITRVHKNVLGKKFHPECFVCSYCNQIINKGSVEYGGNIYHDECNPSNGKIVCGVCKKNIIGRYIISNKINYHQECFESHVINHCCVCGIGITDTYIKDEWGNFAHSQHNDIQSEFCFSCRRIISGKSSNGGKRVDEKRIICGYCISDVVAKPHEIQKNTNSVFDIFSKKGISGISPNIPVHIVSGSYFSELGENTGRGLRLGINKHRQIIVSGTTRHTFEVYIIDYLPSLFFQGILAHELLHTWLTLYAIPLPDNEVEGFCNLGSYLIYSNQKSKLSNELIRKMHADMSPVYGEGFQLMNKRLEKLGWPGLLKAVSRQ